MPSKHIHESLLNGIANLLSKVAPELFPIVETIRATATFRPMPFGETGYSMLFAVVPRADALKVNAALDKYVIAHGRAATFEGWHVDFLAMSWRRFTGLKEGVHSIE